MSFEWECNKSRVQHNLIQGRATRFRADAEERNYQGGDLAARRVSLLRACILIIHARRRAFYRGNNISLLPVP